MTQGEYFYAGTAEDLKKVYETLSSRLMVEKKETEITACWRLAAARAGAAGGRAVAAVVQPGAVTRADREFSGQRCSIPASKGHLQLLNQYRSARGTRV